MKLLTRLLSYFVPVKVTERVSAVSGLLDVRWENGHLALNGPTVNYSFNRLHRVMRRALTQASAPLDEGQSVLDLGMGAGSVVSILKDEFRSKATITSVELDAEVIAIAKEYFDIERYDRHQIVCGDALAFVSGCTEKFDLIVVDLFVDDIVPEQVRRVAFVNELLSILKPSGRILFNHLHDRGSGGYLEVLDALGMSSEQVTGIPKENNVLIYRRS